MGKEAFPMPANWDVRGLIELNSLVRNNPLAAELIPMLGNNPFIRGFPVFFSIVALWFSTGCRERRRRILVGLFGTFVATILAVWMQHSFVFHLRPFLDTSLHLGFVDPASTLNWDHVGSFPSDSATLFFSLVAVIFIENRMAGCFAFLWSLATVGVTRVALGWHYPSDIAGGLILGVACVYLLTRVKYLRTLAEELLQRCESRIFVVHALVFLFLADAYTLFPGLGDIAWRLHGVLKGLTMR
jgi:undecaprenyl-diphosphatase